MGLRRKTILLLIFSSFMIVGWGQDCVDGVEVKLWGECYNIEETTDLDLDYSGLIGEIPPEIGSLINLERIFLGNNQLFGTIPSELGNLTNLYFLDLSSNLLSGLIPESICNLEWNFSMIHNNQLCPPYPECIEGYVGYQDTSECEEECILGDINNDSILNILDIVSMITLILDGEYDECGDVNSDGTINVQDVVIFVNIILSTP